jgi:hypothetical protein
VEFEQIASLSCRPSLPCGPHGLIRVKPCSSIQIDLSKQVLSKQIRHGYLMQNLAEEFEPVRPGPTRDELNHMLNLP